MSAAGNPAYTGCTIPPISPMSWKGGSQKTPPSPTRCAEMRWMTAELCSRFACVSITPRGSPVDPDVYWSIARSDADGANVLARSPSPCSDETSIQRTSLGALPSASQLSSRAASDACTSATRACESAMMPWTRGSARRGLGGYAGTATTPAYRQPKNDATYSSPGGTSSTTRSPGAACSPSAAAMERARSRSS